VIHVLLAVSAENLLQDLRRRSFEVRHLAAALLRPACRPCGCGSNAEGTPLPPRTGWRKRRSATPSPQGEGYCVGPSAKLNKSLPAAMHTYCTPSTA
jgi:hypothetical protein